MQAFLSRGIVCVVLLAFASNEIHGQTITPAPTTGTTVPGGTFYATPAGSYTLAGSDIAVSVEYWWQRDDGIITPSWVDVTSKINNLTPPNPWSYANWFGGAKGKRYRLAATLYWKDSNNVAGTPVTAYSTPAIRWP